MKLTKEQAIKEHRKMWNWIADQYEEGRAAAIYELKSEYMGEYMEETELEERPFHNCFCCEYASEKVDSMISSAKDIASVPHRCMQCPVIWGTELKSHFFACEHSLSAYQRLKEESDKFNKLDVDSELCARLARAIANLPERECV